MNPLQVFLKLSKVLTKKEKIYSSCILFLMIIAMLFEMVSVGSFLPLTSSLLDNNYIPGFLNKLGLENQNISFNHLLDNGIYKMTYNYDKYIYIYIHNNAIINI